MKLGDGLFLNTFRRVAEEYKSSGIEFNDMIVDNTYAPLSDAGSVLPYLTVFA